MILQNTFCLTYDNWTHKGVFFFFFCVVVCSGILWYVGGSKIFYNKIFRKNMDV